MDKFTETECQCGITEEQWVTCDLPCVSDDAQHLWERD